MSLHLNFEPHSWYMGFAIQKDYEANSDTPRTLWRAYTDDGNTYRVIEFCRYQLQLVKEDIRNWHLKNKTGDGERIAKRRLEYLRGELRAERMSYGEVAELQGLADYIEPGDVELLEPAGVPEGSR